MGNLFANADNAADLKEMVDKAELTIASDPWAAFSPMRIKPTNLRKWSQKLNRPDRLPYWVIFLPMRKERMISRELPISSMQSWLEGGNSTVFENLVEVANVFEKVSDSADSTVDADFARNILGNADKASEVSKAMDLVAGSAEARTLPNSWKLPKKA